MAQAHVELRGAQHRLHPTPLEQAPRRIEQRRVPGRILAPAPGGRREERRAQLRLVQLPILQAVLGELQRVERRGELPPLLVELRGDGGLARLPQRHRRRSGRGGASAAAGRTAEGKKKGRIRRNRRGVPTGVRGEAGSRGEAVARSGASHKLGFGPGSSCFPFPSSDFLSSISYFLFPASNNIPPRAGEPRGLLTQTRAVPRPDLSAAGARLGRALVRKEKENAISILRSS